MIIHNDIEKVNAIKPNLYRFLKKIGFSRSVDEQGCTRYDVEMIVSNIRDNGVSDLKMRCLGATSISIGNIESMAGMLLDIEDISTYQLEGVRYRITEQEENTFSFDCSDFYIELIAPMAD